MVKYEADLMLQTSEICCGGKETNISSCMTKTLQSQIWLKKKDQFVFCLFFSDKTEKNRQNTNKNTFVNAPLILLTVC